MTKCKHCGNLAIDDKHPYCYPCNNLIIIESFEKRKEENEENLKNALLEKRIREIVQECLRENKESK